MHAFTHSFIHSCVPTRTTVRVVGTDARGVSRKIRFARIETTEEA